MSSFFKKFGKGVLYLFVLPFMLLILSIWAVVGIGIFFFLGIKWFALFFTGRSLFDDLPEDIKAKEIIKTTNNFDNPFASASPIAQPSINYDNSQYQQDNQTAENTYDQNNDVGGDENV